MMFLATLPSWLKWSLAGIAGVVLITAVFLWIDAGERADDRANQEVGATIQREGDQAKTIENVGVANDTRADVEASQKRNNGRNPEFYASCLRSARTPENCKRFMPD